jgi:methyl-accepting chemotaxis protein
MSGEATRDVTVRVSVVGGKVDKFPDFAKMTTAAEGFLQTVESGLKILKSDSETAMAATSKLTDQLREAASMDFGDLGLGEARAAVEEMVAALDEIGNAGDIDLAGVADSASGLNDVTSAMEDIASSVGDVAREIETATSESDRLAASLGDIDSSSVVDPASVRQFADEATKASSAAGDLADRLREAAGTNLGDVGLGDVKAAVQQISGAVENVPSIDLGGGQAKQDADEIKAAIESLNEEISQSAIDPAGVREFASQAQNAADATGDFTDRLREAAGTQIGDLGLGAAVAAVEEMASSVESLGETVNSEVNQTADSVGKLTAEASLLSDETSKVSDNLRTASEANLGDLGLGEAKAAVEDISAAVAGIGDVGDFGLGGVKAAVEEISGVVENVPPIDLGGSEAKQNADQVKSAIEALNEEISHSVAGLEASWAAADELAAAGEKVEDDLAASLATAAQEAENLAQAELDAKYEVEDATKAAKAATQDEGKTSQEVTFKKIALQERLAAYQRKVKDETIKQEKEKEAAFKKSGEEQQKQMFAASGALAQSLAAGTQFIATLQLIGGESEEIEELARQFAKVQGIVAGISAGTQAFNSLNAGLGALQASAAAATAQLTATGGAATFTQGALIRLAPAAATAQAALGPVAIAITGIALAVTAVMAVSKYFKDDLPDETEVSRRAFERLNRELDETKRKVDASARSLDVQNHFLRAELELRTLLKGGTTAADVEEGFDLDVKSAVDSATSRIQAERANAAKTAAELKAERDALQKENDKIFRSGRGITGNKEMTSENRETFEENKRRMWELDQSISEQRTTAAGVGVELTATTMNEFAEAIKELPDEQRATAEQTLKDFQMAIQTAVESAKSQFDTKLSENTAEMNQLRQDRADAMSKFENEQNIALRLQAPEARQTLEKSVTEATATGNLNAGIDAISGVVSADREQELRNKLAEGNLTRQRLLEEIADAAEFETERDELKKQVDALNQQADALAATREELTKSQQRVREEMRALHEELRQTQMAQQTR